MSPLARALLDGLTVPSARLLRAVLPAARLFARLLRLIHARAALRGPVPVTTQFDGALRTAGTGGVSLGEDCRLGAGVFLETQAAGKIEIGARVRLNAGTHVVAYERIRIGDDTLVGEYVTIRDANHGTDRSRRIRDQPHDASPIEIGRDVWIGRGCVILRGVSIGDGTIVGANSVVTRSLPEGILAAGAPARAIGTRA